MMSTTEQAALISFVVNFARVLHRETDMDREQALKTTSLATAALLGCVLHVSYDDELARALVTESIAGAIRHFYPRESEAHT